jgi:hypothetical protein
MDKAKICSAVSVFLGLFFCCQIARAQISPKTATGVIRGHIVNATGTGIPGVTILFLHGDVGSYATTDCSGFYRQPYLLAGSYTVQISSPGYLAEVRNAVPVNTSLFTEVNAKLQPGNSADGPAIKSDHYILIETSGGPLLMGDITGKVTDNGDAPIPGAKVMAIGEMTGYMQETTTDQTGHYELMVSTPGRYGVWAMQRGFKPEIVRAVPVGMETKAVIDIRLNVENRSSVEVTPNPVPADSKKLVEAGGEIYGRVMDANGMVPARITATELATGKRYETITDSRGDYRFAHLPAGHYCSKFEASGARYGVPEPEYETSRQVGVERAGSTELNMALPAIPGKN